jgi:hypothetical protein
MKRNIDMKRWNALRRGLKFKQSSMELLSSERPLFKHVETVLSFERNLDLIVMDLTRRLCNEGKSTQSNISGTRCKKSQ